MTLCVLWEDRESVRASTPDRLTSSHSSSLSLVLSLVAGEALQKAGGKHSELLPRADQFNGLQFTLHLCHVS